MGILHMDARIAHKAAKNLQLQGEEMEAQSKALAQQAEELMCVWHGASAKRVEAAMMGRSKDADKLATNLKIISSSIETTAKLFEFGEAITAPFGINIGI